MNKNNKKIYVNDKFIVIDVFFSRIGHLLVKDKTV